MNDNDILIFLTVCGGRQGGQNYVFGMEEAALLRDFSLVAIELEAYGGSLYYYHYSFLSATMVIRSGIRWLICTVLSFCCLGAPLYFWSEQQSVYSRLSKVIDRIRPIA